MRLLHHYCQLLCLILHQLKCFLLLRELLRRSLFSRHRPLDRCSLRFR